MLTCFIQNLKGKQSAVSSQQSAVSSQFKINLVPSTGFGLGLWPRYANGHAVRTTLSLDSD
ncbi:MAG: hypothetical protein F6K50_34905 [Moorea sp. SIO3I7]|uniref:hypothetical protein n=1 Tax=Moorena TaxID=1155738 RepID=UPI00117FF8DB|nr:MULTISPECIES: hypothetical protein [Moorena]NEO00453.1 hypothetical protein [Moorena sp. SIO3I7]NEO45750.1 hypothetical protein [Moorena sp. SIO4A3]NEO65326.1 hypothetical protein [Moorena sp. SIO4G2]NEO10911.1 hypothetical protein [Moorena sp. SIO3E8]NEP97399.1 hypothetical protein [Moorena sp. SIO3F7]